MRDLSVDQPLYLARRAAARFVGWLDTPSPLPYALVCLGVMALLSLRAPVFLARPQIAWDDATFLTDGIARPLRETLLTPVQGYLHLIPRLVASAFSPITVLYAPIGFGLTSLLFVAMALAMPASHHFSRWLPPSARLSIVLVTTLLPWQSEVMGNVASIHFIVFYATALATFLPFERLGWAAHAALVALTAAAFSSPFCATLLPLLALRALAGRRRLASVAWPLLLMSAILLHVVLVARLVPPGQEGINSQLQGVSLFDELRFLQKAVGYKTVLLTVCGARFSHHFLEHHFASSVGVGVLLVALGAAVLSPGRGTSLSERLGPPLVCLYLIVVPTAFVGYLRPNYVAHFVLQDAYYGADRYFLTPACFAVALAVFTFARLVQRWPGFRVPRLAALVLYVPVLALNFSYAPLPRDGWRRQVVRYYRVLLDQPPDKPTSGLSFTVHTYPGGGYSVQLPVFPPTEDERRRLNSLLVSRPRTERDRTEAP